MSTLIAKEDKEQTSDTNMSGNLVNSAMILATAMINSGNPLRKIKVIEVHLEYEMEEIGQTVFVEYSNSGEFGWHTYATLQLDPTSVPTVVSCRRTIIHHNIQLRLRTTALGKLRVLAFIPYVVVEAKVHP